MNFGKSIGVSAGIHLVFLLAFGLASLIGKPEEFVAETVRIRIRMQGPSGSHSGTQAGEPSVMNREIRTLTEPAVPQVSQGKSPRPKTVNRKVPDPVDESIASDISSPTSELPVSDFLLEGMDAPDPLLGIDDGFVETSTPSVESSEMWNVSWSDGRERAILSVPVVDESELPEAIERLSGLQIAITVSPAGEVVAAEILEPGSGDTRIDRYLNNLALNFVLEPGFAEDGKQKGVLRLVLSERRE